MYLDSYSARGFRSLAHVTDIPISRPTVLAGRNDGGKSAVLIALAFLLGTHRLTDEDRTYAQDEEGAKGRRCAETWVEGKFRLDAEEQLHSGLGEHVRIRRRSRLGRRPAWSTSAASPPIRNCATSAGCSSRR